MNTHGRWINFAPGSLCKVRLKLLGHKSKAVAPLRCATALQKLAQVGGGKSCFNRTPPDVTDSCLHRQRRHSQGMNSPRLILSIIAVFIGLFATDFLIHAVWLVPDYKSIA